MIRTITINDLLIYLQFKCRIFFISEIMQNWPKFIFEGLSIFMDPLHMIYDIGSYIFGTFSFFFGNGFEDVVLKLTGLENADILNSDLN